MIHGSTGSHVLEYSDVILAHLTHVRNHRDSNIDQNQVHIRKQSVHLSSRSEICLHYYQIQLFLTDYSFL